MTQANYVQGFGGGGCFTGDTLVSTPDGQVRIDELKEGSEVISFDDKGDTHAAKVLKVHVHDDEQVYRYGFWGDEYVDATPNHWVLNQYNAFVAIGSLGSDDCLVDVMGHLRPITSRKDLGTTTVYNLTVEHQHTFIANNIRVHNAGIGQRIAGAGGGGGKGGGGGTRTPTEADDTLQSVQFANVLDLISEGEIQGLDDGNKSIFLDNTPVQNPDGSNNFSGYTVVTRNGTQQQTHIPGDFGSTQSERSVNVEVRNGSPITQTVQGQNVDRLRVTLTIPSLQIIEDDGDIIGHSVQIKIQVQYDGGGFNDVLPGGSDTISGKSSNRYQRDYMINLTSSTNVQVRMIRVSADETSNRRASTTIFQSFTEIIDEKFSYPNSALVALRFDSREFNSIPTRKYLIRGIKVRIPSNATVDTTTHLGRITYSGVWNGTFQAATWTNDPAWCLYDLLISERYGAGIPESTLDKYDFFAISQYCNELVDNGRGGQEPRFSLNMLINSRSEVYNVIQEMTAIFRGIAYYGAGSLVLNQDKPTDTSYAIGPSNVIDGLFEYSGTSQSTRHTVATVAYQNYDTEGDTEFEYVEDHDAVAKYGIINKDIKAVGCYSQGQAHRIGKWTLLSEQNLTETCSFAVGIESGIIIRPGQVIDIADPVRSGVRRSGRVSSSTATKLTVDSSQNLTVSLASSTNSPKVTVMLPSGIAETRNIPAGGIQPQTDGTATIDVTTAFSQIPTAGSVFLVQTSDIESQQFRVLSVAETEDGVYGVTAAAYNSTIYDAVERGTQLTNRDITNLSATPNPVTSIAVEEFLYETGQGVFVGASISWEHDRVNISEFRVQYRIDNDNFETLTTAAPSITVRDIRAGTLHVQVQARNYLNRGSTITTSSFAIAGKTAAPQLITDENNANWVNFSMIPVNGQAKLTWRQSLDLDVRNGGHVRLRHSPNTSNVTWSNSTSISEEIAGSATEAYADLKGGTYSMKFVDSGGRESQNFALIEYTKPELESTEQVSSLSATEDPTFPGNKTNLSVDSVDQEIEMSANGSVLHTTGEYKFNGNPYTLDKVGSLKLEGTVRARAYFPNANLLDSVADFDSIADFDGTSPTTCDVKLYVRTTEDAPPGGGYTDSNFTSWRHFNNAEIKCRAFELKAEFETNDNTAQISVDQLRVKALMPYRSLSGSVQTSSTGDVSVSFGTGNGFYVNPSVGIIFNAQASGDFYKIENLSPTGFDISVYASNGTTRRAQTVRWNAVGHGRG